jgi:hypothetical protein
MSYPLLTYSVIGEMLTLKYYPLTSGGLISVRLFLYETDYFTTQSKDSACKHIDIGEDLVEC